MENKVLNIYIEIEFEGRYNVFESLYNDKKIKVFLLSIIEYKEDIQNLDFTKEFIRETFNLTDLINGTEENKEG